VERFPFHHIGVLGYLRCSESRPFKPHRLEWSRTTRVSEASCGVGSSKAELSADREATSCGIEKPLRCAIRKQYGRQAL
jgi:hypothetical protein